MGTASGCIVEPGIEEFLVGSMPEVADAMMPNHIELQKLSGRTIETMEEAILASREIIARGPRVILVKHLIDRNSRADTFNMLAVTATEAWFAQRPLYPVRAATGRRGRPQQRRLRGPHATRRLSPRRAGAYACRGQRRGEGDLRCRAVRAGNRGVAGRDRETDGPVSRDCRTRGVKIGLRTGTCSTAWRCPARPAANR